MKKIRKGFTLIEMVIVLFIISLLLLIMIPNLASQKTHAQNESDKAFRTTIVTQAELYSESNGNTEKINLTELKEKGYISEGQFKHAQDLKLETIDLAKDKDEPGKVNEHS